MPLPWFMVYFFLFIMYFFIFIYINYLGSLEYSSFSFSSKKLNMDFTSLIW